MDIRELFERNNVASNIGSYECEFDDYINAGKKFIGPDNLDDKAVEAFLTGKGGIASIEQTVSGLGKDDKGNPWNNETYSKAVIQKRQEIRVICENKDFKFNKDWYQKLLDLFPTPKPNNITNRFLSTIFYNDLTTIVSWEELKGVLDFIGESEILKGKRSDKIHWLELNNYLNKKIKETLGDLGVKTDENKNVVPALGWQLVEFIRDLKNEETGYVKELLENNYNVILTGAPGTGKTYMAKKIAAKMIGCSDNELGKNAQFGFVQFHPSYDYTDFVEGLRPVKGTGNKGVDFELKDGVFKQFCIKALNNPDKPFVFVIDEINRGEMSKIFGELFFSIDPGYRGEQGAVQTQYANMVKWGNQFDWNLDNGKKGQFFVPKNVYIIGTMNDIDRSVESMDFAFRRRFAFYEVKATNHMIDNFNINCQEVKNLLKNMMTSINDKILELGLTESYQIGGAYFRKIDNYYTEEPFNITKFKSATTELWNYHLKGTLYEYFRGEPDADKKIDELKKAYDNAIANG